MHTLSLNLFALLAYSFLLEKYPARCGGNLFKSVESVWCIDGLIDRAQGTYIGTRV
jgi:hypothetical protein